MNAKCILLLSISACVGCGSSLPPPAEPEKPTPTVDVSLPRIPADRSERPVKSLDSPVDLPPGQWLRVTSSLKMPANETYSGEPVVATFCKPGWINKGHINPAVAFPGEQAGDVVPLEIVAQIPQQSGSYELWILVELQPVTMRKVYVKK